MICLYTYMYNNNWQLPSARNDSKCFSPNSSNKQNGTIKFYWLEKNEVHFSWFDVIKVRWKLHIQTRHSSYFNEALVTFYSLARQNCMSKFIWTYKSSIKGSDKTWEVSFVSQQGCREKNNFYRYIPPPLIKTKHFTTPVTSLNSFSNA